MTDNTVWIGAHELTPNDPSAGVKTANAAVIQAAIDYACANNRQTVHVPSGNFYCDPGIYLDPPSNMRTNFASPPLAQFSLHLQGAGGAGSQEPQSTVLRFTDNTTTALITGIGQGMSASHINIVGPFGATSRAALPVNGIGIGLAGGGGGIHKWMLANVSVWNFRRGVVTGFNNDQMCDSGLMFKCSVNQCHTGFHVSRTQNYINTLLDCDFGGNKIHILSDVAKAVNVYGGNYSTSDARKKAFTIGTVSALANVADNNGQLNGSAYNNATFTAVVASPDQPLKDGAYDAFVIDTVAFGPVPLLIAGYDQGTSTATFTFQVGWVHQHFGIYGDFETSALGNLLEAALQASTTLYACETIMPFSGPCFNVDGVHIENPGAMTRLFDNYSGFGGDTASRFNRLTFNYELDHASSHGGSADNEAVFLCQQVHPFVSLLHSAPARLEMSNIATAGTANRVIIDARESPHRLTARHCNLRPNIRVALQPGFANESGVWHSTGTGFGEWDSTPFYPDSPGWRGSLWPYHAEFHSGVPFRGYFPAVAPSIPRPRLADIQTGPPVLGTYTPLCGGIVYQVDYAVDDGKLPPAPSTSDPLLVRSNHSRWSYGQDLTIDWSYVGGTRVMRVDDATRLFQGLRISLDNGGGEVGYIVTGVYPALGFVTVVGNYNGALAGAVATTYTGSVVKQEPYSITTIG